MSPDILFVRLKKDSAYLSYIQLAFRIGVYIFGFVAIVETAITWL